MQLQRLDKKLLSRQFKHPCQSVADADGRLTSDALTSDLSVKVAACGGGRGQRSPDHPPSASASSLAQGAGGEKERVQRQSEGQAESAVLQAIEELLLTVH